MKYTVYTILICIFVYLETILICRLICILCISLYLRFLGCRDLASSACQLRQMSDRQAATKVPLVVPPCHTVSLFRTALHLLPTDREGIFWMTELLFLLKFEPCVPSQFTSVLLVGLTCADWKTRIFVPICAAILSDKLRRSKWMRHVAFSVEGLCDKFALDLFAPRERCTKWP